MARYKVPPDPRDSAEKIDSNRSSDRREPIPWLWLALGVVVTLVGIGLSLALLRAFLLRPPLPVDPLEPTLIILTAPPSPTPSPTPVIIAPPTALPTFTPAPTPDVAVAPDEITPGYYAQVVNTDGIGVTVRGGPSTNNAPLTVAPENDTLLVLDGPAEANEFLWWQVRLTDGTEGWVAGDFLTPAAAP